MSLGGKVSLIVGHSDGTEREFAIDMAAEGAEGIVEIQRPRDLAARNERHVDADAEASASAQPAAPHASSPKVVQVSIGMAKPSPGVDDATTRKLHDALVDYVAQGCPRPMPREIKETMLHYTAENMPELDVRTVGAILSEGTVEVRNHYTVEPQPAEQGVAASAQSKQAQAPELDVPHVLPSPLEAFERSQRTRRRLIGRIQNDIVDDVIHAMDKKGDKRYRVYAASYARPDLVEEALSIFHAKDYAVTKDKDSVPLAQSWTISWDAKDLEKK